MNERNVRLELVVLLFVQADSKTPPTKADACKALLPLLLHVGGTEARRRIDAAFDTCVAAGELEVATKARSRRFSVSQLGEIRLESQFVKLAKASWPKLRDEYLIPRAAAGSSTAPPGLKAYSTLRSYLALRSNGIEYRAGLREAAVLDRIAAKAVGASRADKTAIKTSVIRLWLDTDTAATDAPALAATTQAGVIATFDLDAFANQVNEVARQSLTGRWGSDKIFVNHVWRQVQSLRQDGGLDARTFKSRLLEANGRGLVRLSRADLVISMPPDDVRESEIPTLGNDVFHFINI